MVEKRGFAAVGNARTAVGILPAISANVNTKSKFIDGWKIKTWVDWVIAWTSFVVFVTLEAALFYSYCVFLRIMR